MSRFRHAQATDQQLLADKLSDLEDHPDQLVETLSTYASIGPVLNLAHWMLFAQIRIEVRRRR